MPAFHELGADGDSILHPDFWRLLELIHEHDIKFTILGNPFHLNDQVCRELKWYGCDTYFNKKDHLWTLYEYETGEFKIPENAEKGMIRSAGRMKTENCFRR